jgi:uncharacterized membrane protein HdeD (DUF308 family)
VLARLRWLLVGAMLRLRASPWGRAALGAVLVAAGVAAVVVGAGHGRLVAVGIVLLLGGLLAGVKELRERRAGRRGPTQRGR